MINLEIIKIMLSMVNIIAISVLVYKRQYKWAWALAILQTFVLVGAGW